MLHTTTELSRRCYLDKYKKNVITIISTQNLVSTHTLISTQHALIGAAACHCDATTLGVKFGCMDANATTLGVKFWFETCTSDTRRRKRGIIMP